MTVPLILLALGAITVGLMVGVPPETGLIARWLEPVFAGSIAAGGGEPAGYQLFGIDGALVLLSVGIATVGIVAAWRLFGVDLPGLRGEPRPESVRRLSARLPFLYRASLNKWWFDDLYDLLFVRIGGRIAAFAWWFDRTVVDGAVNGIGTLTTDAGRGLRRFQTGRVQDYALGIAIGLIVMAGAYLAIAMR